MTVRPSRVAYLAVLSVLVCLSAAGAQSNDTQKKQKKQKPLDVRIENYFGGIFFIGDGGIPSGPCFRINGRVTSGDFFNDLKSYDSDDGVTFKRGQSEVTDFPDDVFLSFAIHDQPCDYGLQSVGTGVYLTPQEMGTLKLSLYWKHGLDMRPVGKIALEQSSVVPVAPYAKTLAEELPKRYVWSYALDVPASAVPLTDSLVLIFRNPEGHIVARVAARL
jgi:hypothetical protein